MDGQGKYAVLARGEAQLFTRLPRAGYRENIWDVAAGRLRGMHTCALACARAWACKMRACAGALLVEEAGGRVSDLEGLPLDFSRGAPPRPLPDRTHLLERLRQCSPGCCRCSNARPACNPVHPRRAAGRECARRRRDQRRRIPRRGLAGAARRPGRLRMKCRERQPAGQNARGKFRVVLGSAVLRASSDYPCTPIRGRTRRSLGTISVLFKVRKASASF